MRANGQKRILVDATAIMRWGIQPCTGYHRVELGLCEHALKNPETFDLCVMDKAIGRYQLSTAATRSFVQKVIDFNAARASGDVGKLSLAEQVCVLRYADNEVARATANRLLKSPRRKGFAYEATKLALRLFIWSYAGLRWCIFNLKRPFVDFGRSTVADHSVQPIVLVSHATNRSLLIERALASMNAREVNVIYDLIPVRNLDLVSKRYNRSMDGLFRRIGKAGNTIISISNTTRDHLIEYYRDENIAVDPANIHVCQLNSPLNDAAERATPVAALEGKAFAFYCATVDIRKCHWLLVRAWEQLARKLPHDALPWLVLAGRKGNDTPRLNEAMAALDAARGRVLYLDNVPDSELRWLYSNARLGLFPSLAEGWGLGVSEALSYGKPVVHSDIPILHEAAQGLMPSAEAGNVDAWVETLHGIFAESGRLDALAEAVKTQYRVGKPDDFARCVVSHLDTPNDAEVTQQ